MTTVIIIAIVLVTLGLIGSIKSATERHNINIQVQQKADEQHQQIVDLLTNINNTLERQLRDTIKQREIKESYRELAEVIGHINNKSNK